LSLEPNEPCVPPLDDPLTFFATCSPFPTSPKNKNTQHDQMPCQPPPRSGPSKKNKNHNHPPPQQVVGASFGVEFGEQSLQISGIHQTQSIIFSYHVPSILQRFLTAAAEDPQKTQDLIPFLIMYASIISRQIESLPPFTPTSNLHMCSRGAYCFGADLYTTNNREAPIEQWDWFTPQQYEAVKNNCLCSNCRVGERWEEHRLDPIPCRSCLSAWLTVYLPPHIHPREAINNYNIVRPAQERQGMPVIGQSFVQDTQINSLPAFCLHCGTTEGMGTRLQVYQNILAAH